MLLSREVLRFARASFVGGLVLLITWQACSPAAACHQDRFEHAFRAMGVQFRIVLYASSSAQANQAFAAAEKRAIELDQIFSDYKSDSESRRLVEQPLNTPIDVSSDLYFVIGESQRYSRETEGAFDITVGNLSRIWRLARSRNRLPAEPDVTDALSTVGYENLRLKHPNQIILNTAGMRLDFGAIAKGYAADECLKLIRSQGLNAAFVDASGNVALGDPPPNEKGWVVGVSGPKAEGPDPSTLELSNCGVATSSDQHQFLEADGKRYSHIIDPRSGWALTNRLSVTVVAPSAMAADVWGTAFAVQGVEWSQKVSAAKGIQCIFR